jgi:hypothetical protein
MGKWRDARTAEERRELLAWAGMAPTVKDAAAELGITRRHLSRLLSGETRRTKRTRCLLVTNTHPVTRTDCESLTYGHAGSDILGVPATQPATTDGEVLSVTLDLPKACVEWIELEAVRWKHRTGAPHPAKSPVVADLIREAMRQRQQ